MGLEKIEEEEKSPHTLTGLSGEKGLAKDTYMEQTKSLKKQGKCAVGREERISRREGHLYQRCNKMSVSYLVMKQCQVK